MGFGVLFRERFWTNFHGSLQQKSESDVNRRYMGYCVTLYNVNTECNNTSYIKFNKSKIYKDHLWDYINAILYDIA